MSEINILFLRFCEVLNIAFKNTFCRDFPGDSVVKTLPCNAGGAGSISGWGARIPHASRPKNQNKKQKQYCNKFNKDFKNGPHQKKIFKKKEYVLSILDMVNVI